MGWGIMGGAAVDAYQKASKLDRERQWEDLQRAEWQRQHAQDVAIDTAMNSDVTPPTPSIPTPDQSAPAPAPAAPDNYDPMDGSAPKGSGLPKGAPPSALYDPGAMPAPDVSSVRSYTGDDGKTYQSAAPHYTPKPSELMLARADAIMKAGAGAKGMQAAMNLRTQALQTMQQERDMELQSILSSNTPTAQKVQGLLHMVNGSPITPGDVTLEKRDDGIYMVHNVPGKGSMPIKLNGNSEDEILQDLAYKARAMTNPELYLKKQEYDMHKQHYERMDDNRADANAARAEYQAGLLDMKGRDIEMRGEIGALRGAMYTRGNWMPYGTDKTTGQEVLYDNNTGEVKYIGGGQVKDMSKIEPYNKVTGNKAGAGSGLKLPQTLTDAQKIAYPKALDELGPKPTPAEKMAVASKYNLPPELFGTSALPPPSALPRPGTPAAPAAAPAVASRPTALPQYGNALAGSGGFYSDRARATREAGASAMAAKEAQRAANAPKIAALEQQIAVLTMQQRMGHLLDPTRLADLKAQLAALQQ